MRASAGPMGGTAVVTEIAHSARAAQVLRDAEHFYAARLSGSWVPSYLRERGFDATVATEWRFGYAPGGWTALTDHLLGLGHHRADIEAAGLARRARHGRLIDHFRDRAMLAIRGLDGTIAGFIGRARPGTGPGAPKYLNSPETAAYKKGDVLFGLYEVRERLAHGAIPVIVEGPFDAIAANLADARYAGVAPCGTALTRRQVAALGKYADLRNTGVLVALDGDKAGHDAAVKAYDILRTATARTVAVVLPAGRDPAQILQADGPVALASALRAGARPLASLVIDARLGQWGRRLDDPAGQLYAMRDVAALVASIVPAEAAARILQISRGQNVSSLDEKLHPLAVPELPQIARVLPADLACQIVRVADRLGFSCYSDILAEITNAVVRAGHAKRPARWNTDKRPDHAQ